jgi:GntR family transcriptional regulator
VGLSRANYLKVAALVTTRRSLALLLPYHYRRHQQEGQPGFLAQVRELGHTPRQEIIEVATIMAPPVVIERLGLEEGAEVVMRRLRFLVDDEPVQLVNVYYDSRLAAGSQLERPVLIADGVHAELRRLGVQVTRFVEDFQGARLPSRDEQRALQLPSGVPVTRNIRTAYAGDQPVEVMDTISTARPCRTGSRSRCEPNLRAEVG